MKENMRRRSVSESDKVEDVSLQETVSHAESDPELPRRESSSYGSPNVSTASLDVAPIGIPSLHNFQSTSRSASCSPPPPVSRIGSSSSRPEELQDHLENGELTYGQRLMDDLLNTFCDKLQNVAPMKIEGMLAIQFLTVEPANIHTFISGKNLVLQLIFDYSRVHYVLTSYDPRTPETVYVYDSLQCYQGGFECSESVPHISDQVHGNIRTLYEHLFPSKQINVAIDANFSQQQEDWSCGYRAMAAVVDIARGIRPGSQEYSRRKIYDFLKQIFGLSQTDLGHVPECRFRMNTSSSSSTEFLHSGASLQPESTASSRPLSRLSSSSDVSINTNSNSRKRAGRDSPYLMNIENSSPGGLPHWSGSDDDELPTDEKIYYVTKRQPLTPNENMQLDVSPSPSRNMQ
ncbi:unnamed protein product [Caenorhabditis auriculariae]|uniref:Ubiquitin-like protease family profile domain-containing protein n=1 Tax=Caenorhabditis auriculariae TaxID=2777116 RepID=A0A8S1HIB9_9PELO|nr:unnamed protein product [Caenorhabditis auriculariae]